jgi:hypothetical protein
LLDIWGRIGPFISSQGALELITEALRMEVVLWDSYHERCSGDATNIASGRYHAPVIKGSAYEVSYGESLRTMDEHVDGGSNPNEMAEAVYKIIQTKEPRVHYKVGFMQIFDCIETYSTG